jgi:hypothetical protein
MQLPYRFSYWYMIWTIVLWQAQFTWLSGPDFLFLHLALECPSSHENISRTLPSAPKDTIALLLLEANKILQDGQVLSLHIMYAIHRTQINCYLFPPVNKWSKYFRHVKGTNFHTDPTICQETQHAMHICTVIWTKNYMKMFEGCLTRDSLLNVWNRSYFSIFNCTHFKLFWKSPWYSGKDSISKKWWYLDLRIRITPLGFNTCCAFTINHCECVAGRKHTLPTPCPNIFQPSQ